LPDKLNNLEGSRAVPSRFLMKTEKNLEGILLFIF